MNISKTLTTRTLVLMLAFGLALPSAHASPEREFVMSCTYGVLAGTLVGAASLAFVDQPGENLQRVARGASIGLYMGIGLGVYTVYILPKQLEREQFDPDVLPVEGRLEKPEPPKWQLFPIALADGAGMGLNVSF